MSILRGRRRSPARRPCRAGRAAVGVAFHEMETRNGRKALQFIEAEDQRTIYHAVNEQPMLRRIDVPWLVSVRNREMQRSRRDHPQLVLNRVSETVVARATLALRGP